MARRKEKIKVLATQIEYIAPGFCDSTIGYTITKRRYLWGNVQLSDCNRKIEWGFSDSPDSLVKIDKAIEILQNFRRDFIASRRRKKIV
jgi:hypothetical protein